MMPTTDWAIQSGEWAHIVQVSPEEPYALTTYGRSNHAIRTRNYRYIRYECRK